mmetsp:Transcript_66800/g.105563  ORF Transcript_66800/g.105563 Transcript_66800/m.105563 type:complete len:109 (-) Transcript_66800:131-457(-)
MSTPSSCNWQNKQRECLAEIVAVIVIKMPSKALVVLLTETAMEMHVVIPEVEVVTALVDSPVVVGDTLGEGVTPTGVQIHVVTKEAMGEGISRNRMAHGATWVDSRTV